MEAIGSVRLSQIGDLDGLTTPTHDIYKVNLCISVHMYLKVAKAVLFCAFPD